LIPVPIATPGRALLALSAAVALASCEASGTLPGAGSRSDYLVARQALETGNYPVAVRRYAAVIAAVPAGSARRVELEYAHALLRADRHDEAIATAGALMGASDDAIAASARAVRGTARHEAARLRLDAGDRGPETRALLEGARADLATFLRQHAALDAGGAMRARTELIAADLRSL
jgi:hypothetical protein